jgi:hypothetical protein
MGNVSAFAGTVQTLSIMLTNGYLRGFTIYWIES